MTDAMFGVLVVEDDRDIRILLRTLLEAEGYRVTLAESAQRALVEARSHRPDVVIVDLGLPDRDGLAVIHEIRLFSPVPIVVLSARTMETEKVKALDAGADDYVTKPFSSPELLARVRAALRRKARAATPRPVQLGNLNVDLVTRNVVGHNGPVHLTPLEFRLLECLASADGLIVTQERIMREVWGPARMGDTRNLRAYIKMLRQKLEPDPRQPQYIVTEAGVGYRLRADAAPVKQAD
jgi:two-component system KDP operon response regulator KdpE